MLFNKIVIDVSQWYKKLSKRFVDLVPKSTLAIIILTLFSQLFMLASSLMPLKIIMLLSSERIPHYFPHSWHSIDKNVLIIYLACSAVIFFIFHLISENKIDMYVKKGSNDILDNNQKISLYEKPDIFAQTVYAKHTRSLANIIFFLIAFFCITFLYPILAIAILLFLVTGYLIFFLIYFNEIYSKRLETEYSKALNIVKDFGFFLLFGIILASLILDIFAPNIIIAIISILLIRQMMSRLSLGIKDIVFLNKNKLKINSLFFYNHAITYTTDTKDNAFWSLFNEDRKKTWMQKIIGDVMGEKILYQNSSWHQVNIKNIAFFKVSVFCVESKKNAFFLLKIFNEKLSFQAAHEAVLLEAHKSATFSLNFIGNVLIDNFQCNIFKYDCLNTLTQKLFLKKSFNIRLQIMATKPSYTLVNRYIRSHLLLHKRIDKLFLIRLYTVANKDELHLINKLEYEFDNIINILQGIPLQIINPLITRFSLVEKKDKLILLHWGMWKIDLIGTDYPVDIKNIDKLKENYFYLSNKRNDLNDIKIEKIMLVVFLSHFEKLYMKENFSNSIQLIPQILKCIE